jgi:hypothetical protein
MLLLILLLTGASPAEALEIKIRDDVTVKQ